MAPSSWPTPGVVRSGDRVAAAVALNASSSGILRVRTTGGVVVDHRHAPVVVWKDVGDDVDDLIYAARSPRLYLVRLSRSRAVVAVPMDVRSAGTFAVDDRDATALAVVRDDGERRRRSCRRTRLAVGDTVDVAVDPPWVPLPAGLRPASSTACAVWRPKRLGFDVVCAGLVAVHAVSAGTYAAPGLADRRPCWRVKIQPPSST